SRDRGNGGKPKTGFPPFPPSLGNPAKAAGFPLSHSSGDGYLYQKTQTPFGQPKGNGRGNQVKPDRSRVNKSGQIEKLPTEFKVKTSNFSAEFGHSAGAVVSATIKSGANQAHGALFEFLRNDALDATNFFTNAAGLSKSLYRQNQFGFALGGPLYAPKIYN